MEDLEEYAYQIVFFAYLHTEGTHKRYPPLCINWVVPLTSLSNQTNSLHKAYKDQIMKGLFMQRLGQNMIL